MQKIEQSMLKSLREQYGDTFYLLDTQQFRENFAELKKAFIDIYPDFNIAYSYKTNYIPKLCRIVDENGGYAEVVSDMEMEIALKTGVKPEKIIWNGPYKNKEKAELLLLKGGTVNIDSANEIEMLQETAAKNPEHRMNVGIRINFDIGDGVISRFGFDVESEDFKRALSFITATKNLHLAGLQCHFASRKLDTWKVRVKGMISALEHFGVVPDYIDLGGGLFGKMADSLKCQFDSRVPSYKEYAETIAPVFSKYFQGKEKPLLLIEPGSALVGDCMYFACKTVSIKNIRGKSIATVNGSIYNINPTLNTKNPPIQVFHMGEFQNEYRDLDFGGFTCIENDYLYRHFNGKLGVGDMIVFGNVGSYSIVLKPPFILPNVPVIDMENGELIKRKENFDDLFHTFRF